MVVWVGLNETLLLQRILNILNYSCGSSNHWPYSFTSTLGHRLNFVVGLTTTAVWDIIVIKAFCYSVPKLKTLCSGELHDSSDDSLVSATKPATAPNCVTYDQQSVNVDDEETVPQDVSVGLQNLPTSDWRWLHLHYRQKRTSTHRTQQTRWCIISLLYKSGELDALQGNVAEFETSVVYVFYNVYNYSKCKITNR